MMAPITWRIERKNFFPIIDAYAYVVSDDLYVKGMLLKSAVDLINKTVEFGGRPLEISEKDISECRSIVPRDSKLIAGFKIIFKGEEGIMKFQNYLKNSGGAFLKGSDFLFINMYNSNVYRKQVLELPTPANLKRFIFLALSFHFCLNTYILMRVYDIVDFMQFATWHIARNCVLYCT